MKKKLLIVFLICCMFFGVASPAFAFYDHNYQLYPPYSNTARVGYNSDSDISFTYPSTIFLKDNQFYGFTYQVQYDGDIITYDAPSFYVSKTDNLISLYVPKEVIENPNLRFINLTFCAGLNAEMTTVIYSITSRDSYDFTLTSNSDYYVNSFDISVYTNPFDYTDYSLTDFYCYSGNMFVWEDGPSDLSVGELPPQMMNLGITQVEVPVGQQVVGNLQTLLPFGIGLLALLTGLLLLSKVLRRFQR